MDWFNTDKVYDCVKVVGIDLMKKKIVDIFWNIIACGFPTNYDLEILRKLVMLNILIFISSSFLVILGTVAVIQNNILLFAVDFIVAFLLVVLLVWLRIRRDPVLPAHVATFGTGLFFLFLVANGGVNQTAFVWCYTFPLASIFLLGKSRGVAATIVLLVFIIGIFATGKQFPYFSEYSTDLIIRFIASYMVVFLFSFVMEKIRVVIQDQLIVANNKLRESLEEVKLLSGLLPICSSCKKIRDDSGYWNQLETYIHDHSDVEFSHSICPDCAKKLYPEFYKEKVANGDSHSR